jgi:hypothetical protein
VDWVAWLRNMLLRAHYAHLRAGTNGAPDRLTVHWRDWSVASGVPVTSLHNYLERGMQPTASAASGIAESLGLDPLAVFYHGGLFSREQVWQVAGGGRVPTEHELLAEIAAAQQMSDDYALWRDSIIELAERQLQLLREIGPTEYGAAVSERVQREIRGVDDAYQMPSEQPGAPLVTHRPGPRRRLTAPQHPAEDVQDG